MDPMSRSPKVSFTIMLLPILVLFVLIWAKIPLNDPPEYFNFVDTRECAGIPNAWNVLSNLPFLYVAWHLFKTYKDEGAPMYRRPGMLLAFGMLLTALGSSWFHWNPTPHTLFWDRLPMVIAFSGIFLLLVSDRFSTELSRTIEIPLIAISFASVFYWKFAENIRPYAVLQFGLLIFTFMIGVFTRGNRISNASVFGMAGLYFAAKVLEYRDGMIFDVLGNLVSGHSLKHLLAGVAVLVFARGFVAKTVSA